MQSQHDQNPFTADEDADSAADVLRNSLRFARLIQRRRKVIGMFVGAAIIAGIAYYAVAPLQYESVAKLRINQQVTENTSVVGDQFNIETIMASQRDLVRSSKIVQAAIERLRPEHRIDFADSPPREWVDDVQSRLDATAVRKTKHMEVRYRSADPEAAAAVVSAVIDSYIRFVDRDHQSDAAKMLGMLSREREQLSRELVEKQEVLQAFRQQKGHISTQAQSSVVEPAISRAIALNESVLEAQKERLAAQASLSTIQRAMQTGEDLRQYLASVEASVGQEVLLNALGMARQDVELIVGQQKHLLETEAELRHVSQFFGPSHPQVVALTQQAQATRGYLESYRQTAGQRFSSLSNDEIGPILVTMLQQSISQAANREHQLQQTYRVAQAEAVRQSGDLTRLQMLEREVDRIERQHDLLYDKIKSVDLEQVHSPIRVVAIQDPLPDEIPVEPKLPLILVGSAFAGLVLGVLAVYVQDQLDDRFNSPEEISSQLGVPVLSLVRTLQPTGGEGIDAIQMHNGGDDVEIEAFRTLRTALALAPESSDRLVVSSAEPSDGKTTVSANLATAFAQAGKRTLVIDADMRRPGMTALMGWKGQPGLTDLLLTDEKNLTSLAEKIVRSTGIENLDLISAGPRRPNPAELLTSRNFEDLLAWADGIYDQVLIDCPPVLAVSDAQIAGRLVDGVVLVVTPEKNHRRLVTRACESFTSAGVHLFGVIGNRITEQTGGGYGYGYGYGYSYNDDDSDSETIKDEQEAARLFDADQTPRRAA